MTMPKDASADYYEILQISPSAEPETVHRVYRLLAQRLHPDNNQTGNDQAFRALSEAYQVLSDPERRAQYDVLHAHNQQSRWRLVSNGARSENDFETERLVRLTVLEVLYTRRRVEPGSPGLSPRDLETLIGTAREHLEFTVWYLVQKHFVTRNDQSNLTITSEGVDYLEDNYAENLRRRRLTAGSSQDNASTDDDTPKAAAEQYA
jgi:curved DNA-binding protein CbpA